MSNGPEVAAQLDRVAASAEKAEGATAGLTAAQRALMAQGVTLEQVMAAVNGETVNLTAVTGALTNIYDENRAVVLQHIRALEMDAAAEEGAATATGVHGLQLGRVNMELGTAIGRFMGVNTAATRFTAMLGGAVAGYGEMIAISVAIIAVVKAYEALTAATRKAREEQEKATKALKDWYDTEQRGAAGERLQQLTAAEATLTRLTAQYTQLTAVQDAATAAGPHAPNIVVQQGKQAGADAAKIKMQMDALRDQIAAGEADVTKTLTKANIDQQAERERNLAAIVKSDAATSAQRASAREQLKRDLAEDAALMRQYLQSGNPALAGPAAALAGNIAAGNAALDAPGKAAARDAALARREINGVMDDFAHRIKGTHVELSGYTQAMLASATAAEQLGKMLNADVPVIDKVAAANEDAIRKANELIQKIQQTLHADLVSGVDTILTRGLKTFPDFLNSVSDLSGKMTTKIADDIQTLNDKAVQLRANHQDAAAHELETQAGVLQAQLDQLAPIAKQLGQISAGFGIGSTIGQMSASPAVGALAGGAAGAAEGFIAAGPMGALVGGLSGLIGGFLSGATAAQQLAASVADMQRQFKITILTMNEAAGASTSLDVALAKLDESTKQAFAAALDADGVLHMDKLKQDWAQIQKDAAATAAILKAQYALDQKTQTESLQARLLRAKGDTVAADALDLQVQQQQERAKLLESYGLTPDATAAQIATLTAAQQATLALLDQVQAQEKLKAAIDAVNQANENLTDGYKLNLALYKYSPALGGSPLSPTLPTPTPQGGTGVSASTGRPTVAQPSAIVVPVTLTLDGKVVATSTVRQLQKVSQAQFGTTEKWSDVVVS